MIKIRMKKTGEVREVDKNIAHDFIDKGEAELVKKEPEVTPKTYQHRQMRQKHTR